MCTHMRKIRNIYTGKELFVKCGHCKACLQERANARAARIRRHCADKLCLFVTLTYSDDFLPYIKIDDLMNIRETDGFISIYRNAVPFVRQSKGSISKSIRYYEHEIGEIQVKDDAVLHKLCIWDFKPVKVNGLFDDSRVSVCYYKDVQNFIKKLRIKLKRNYNYDKPFQYFFCTEYGPTTGRSHIHGVLFCERESSYQMWKRAVAASWSYDDSNRARQCEIARKPASYVASYVNSNKSVPSLLQTKPFRAKSSYSQGLGCADYYFQFDALLQAIGAGSLTYPVQTTRDGIPTTIIVPIPSYVIHRYFPKIKGYCRLTFDEIADIYSHPSRIYGYAKKLSYSPQDCKRTVTMLRNRLKKWIERGDREGFGLWTYLAWSCHSSTKLKLLHEEFASYPQYRYMAYDNIVDMLSLGFYADVVVHNLPSEIIEDPNEYPFRVQKTLSLEQLYDKKDKSRKLNSFRDSVGGFNV